MLSCEHSADVLALDLKIPQWHCVSCDAWFEGHQEPGGEPIVIPSDIETIEPHRMSISEISALVSHRYMMKKLRSIDATRAARK